MVFPVMVRVALVQSRLIPTTDWAPDVLGELALMLLAVIVLPIVLLLMVSVPEDVVLFIAYMLLANVEVL
jgi:hypothetical protein